jgi:hypothetical protein
LEGQHLRKHPDVALQLSQGSPVRFHLLRHLVVTCLGRRDPLLFGAEVVGDELVEVRECRILVKELKLPILAKHGPQGRGVQALYCFLRDEEPLV